VQSSNAAAIVAFLRSKGLSDNQIAGVLGNLQEESGLSPTAYNGREGAIGIAQWEKGRRIALQNYAAAHGGKETDLNMQLGYLWHELTSSESGALAALKGAGSASEAAAAWDANFERSDGTTRGARIQYAQGFLQNGLKAGPMPNVPSGGGGGGSSAGAAGGESAVPAMTADDYMGVDGLGKLLKSIPELSTLVDQAVSGNWSTQKFQNAVEESKWYKTHSNTARSIIAQQMNDPASYKQTLYKTQQTVQKLAQQLGIPLGDGRLQNIASYALLSGHDSDQQWLTDQLFYGRDWRKITDIGQLNGGMANTAQQLQQLASSYGFQWTAPQIASYAQKILDGQTTIDTYKGDLVQWAKSAFPSLAKSLDAGQTVLDAAAPYMQSMSQLLEVDPSQLSLFTPAIRKALQGTQDPKTQERTAVPLWQFEDQVRQDPRWQYTQNAKDTVSSALVQLGATFGFGPQG
jgi:hypothetical protein